ncbi:hypothetical protein ACEWY4_006255 [Coilia grayii]|uniref:non-specific serine/threonine protein kinase n=1 Tax=Coilia grayii TaxID=363190 RepID=A0ABD1KD53_9TELE
MSLWHSSVKGKWPNGKGVSVSFCVASSNDTDTAATEDFVFDRSFPCARRPVVKKKHSLHRWPGDSTGDFKNGHSLVSMRNLQMSDLHCQVSPPGHPDQSPSQLNTVQLMMYNPNTPAFIVNCNTTEIQEVNEQACRLLEYSRSELIGQRLYPFLQTRQCSEEALMGEVLNTDGTVVQVSGEVVDVVSRCKGKLPVSVWTCSLPRDPPHCLVLMEAVEKIYAHVSFSENGSIISCDLTFAHLNGYCCPEQLTGHSITELMPSLKIPPHPAPLTKTYRVQRVKANGWGSRAVSLSVKVRGPVSCGKLLSVSTSNGHQEDRGAERASHSPADLCSSESSPKHPLPSCSPTPSPDGIGCSSPSASPEWVYSGMVRGFAPLSGLLTLCPDGSIHCINNHFALMLFGYKKSELIGKASTNVTFLMPGFFEWMRRSGHCASPVLRQHQDDSDLSSKNSGRSSSGSNAVYGSGVSLSSHSPVEKNNQDTTDPNSVLAGDRATVQQALQRRAFSGKGRIFSRNGDRLGAVSSVSSTMTSPGATSTQLHRPDDTAELFRQVVSLAAQCSVGEEDTDNTHDLLQTFSLIESEKVCGLSSPPHDSDHWRFSRGQEVTGCGSGLGLGRAKHSSRPATDTERDLTKSRGLARQPGVEGAKAQGALQDSSFEVISLGSRSSSGFCEQWGGGGSGSGPDRLDAIHPISLLPATVAPVADSTSGLLDIDSNGDMVTRALEELDLSDILELPAASRAQLDHLNLSQVSCDTAELLRTPSPYVVESEEEVQNPRAEEVMEGKRSLPQDWNTFPTHHSGQVLDLQIMSDLGGQLPGDTPATSTPNKPAQPNGADTDSNCEMVEGSFEGSCYHRDGTRHEVQCEVRRGALPDGRLLFCVWLTGRLPLSSPQGAALSSEHDGSSQFSLQHSFSCGIGQEGSKGEILHSTADLDQSQACKGQFEEEYRPLRALGKGAFNFVWQACRRHDGKEVVVKYIKKADIVSECWVDDSDMDRVSQEIAILARLDHPNIVKVLEVFENDLFFQMVMEQHGDGMDLFDFIDQQPCLNEPLASFIFRQVVAAISYLHDRGILHSDIKDENIIIDRNFHIKLIDFGSATVMEPGKLFHVFRGTLEYCSPEVLLGNAYEGPELEMWSLGVLLYTLLFSEIPFSSIEEMLAAKLKLPLPLSPELIEMLQGLLRPEPTLRMTLQELLLEPWLRQPINLAEYSWTEVLSTHREQDLKLWDHSDKSLTPHGVENLYCNAEDHLQSCDDTPLQDEQEEEDEEEHKSMAALEAELQKYLTDE